MSVYVDMLKTFDYETINNRKAFKDDSSLNPDRNINATIGTPTTYEGKRKRVRPKTAAISAKARDMKL